MITIYGKSNCNFCTKAVELVKTYKMKYEYKDAEEFENFAELQVLRYFGLINISEAIKS